MFEALEKALERVKSSKDKRDQIAEKNNQEIKRLKDEISELDNELQSATDAAHDEANKVQSEMSGLLPGFGGGRTRR